MKKEDIKVWEEELSSTFEQKDYFENDETSCVEIDDGVVCFVTTKDIFESHGVFFVDCEVFFVDYKDREVFYSSYFVHPRLERVSAEYPKRIGVENFISLAGLLRCVDMLLSIMKDYLGEYPELEGVYREFEKKCEYWKKMELFYNV